MGSNSLAERFSAAISLATEPNVGAITEACGGQILFHRDALSSVKLGPGYGVKVRHRRVPPRLRLRAWSAGFVECNGGQAVAEPVGGSLASFSGPVARRWDHDRAMRPPQPRFRLSGRRSA